MTNTILLAISVASCLVGYLLMRLSRSRDGARRLASATDIIHSFHAEQPTQKLLETLVQLGVEPHRMAIVIRENEFICFVDRPRHEANIGPLTEALEAVLPAGARLRFLDFNNATSVGAPTRAL